MNKYNFSDLVYECVAKLLNFNQIIGIEILLSQKLNIDVPTYFSRHTPPHPKNSIFKILCNLKKTITQWQDSCHK